MPRRKKEELFKTPAARELMAISKEMTELEEYHALLHNDKIWTGLPHLYGWKWYTWAREFYESTNEVNLLCAANQISKSSTQIRKCINWATDQTLWTTLWQKAPTQFWYLYPTQKQVNAEFETKWKQFLPRNEYKDDPYFGYTIEKRQNDIVAIHFNSGVHVYFKTYAQDITALQSGTCDAIFCDEELPIALFDELMLRVSASNGYFHMAFTATIGQDEWRRAMEPREGEEEFLVGALKLTVSLYDAQFYEDGKPSHWTKEKIKKIEARCSTHNELLKRVHGKFIVDDDDRKCPTFDPSKHVKPAHTLPKSWLTYTGVDIGGGGKGHLSAIVFVAVRSDYRKGKVFLGWRGDGITTTSGDVFEKHTRMKTEAKVQATSQRYDWGAKDFGEIARRAGDPFERAEKGQEFGADIVNTLFKNNMLEVYDTDELSKLIVELTTLLKSTAKRHAKDDFYDALRYAVATVPWDFSHLGETEVEEPEEELTDLQRQVKERREQITSGFKKEKERLEDEFEEWNEAYGNEF